MSKANLANLNDTVDLDDLLDAIDEQTKIVTEQVDAMLKKLKSVTGAPAQSAISDTSSLSLISSQQLEETKRKVAQYAVGQKSYIAVILQNADKDEPIRRYVTEALMPNLGRPRCMSPLNRVSYDTLGLTNISSELIPGAEDPIIEAIDKGPFFNYFTSEYLNVKEESADEISDWILNYLEIAAKLMCLKARNLELGIQLPEMEPLRDPYERPIRHPWMKHYGSEDEDEIEFEEEEEEEDDLFWSRDNELKSIDVGHSRRIGSKTKTLAGALAALWEQVDNLSLNSYDIKADPIITTDDLINEVVETVRRVKLMELENDVFEVFLRKNDPELLEECEEFFSDSTADLIVSLMKDHGVGLSGMRRSRSRNESSMETVDEDRISESSYDDDDIDWLQWFSDTKRKGMVEQSCNDLFELNMAFYNDFVAQKNEQRCVRQETVLRQSHLNAVKRDFRYSCKRSNLPPEQAPEATLRFIKKWQKIAMKDTNSMFTSALEIQGNIGPLEEMDKYLDSMEENTEYGDVVLQLLQYEISEFKNYIMDGDTLEVNTYLSQYMMKLIEELERLDFRTTRNTELQEARSSYNHIKSQYKNKIKASQKIYDTVKDSVERITQRNVSLANKLKEKDMEEKSPELYQCYKLQEFQKQLTLHHIDQKIDNLDRRLDSLYEEPKAISRLRTSSKRLDKFKKQLILNKINRENPKREQNVKRLGLNENYVRHLSGGELK